MLVTEVPSELLEDVVDDTAGVGATVGAAVGLAVGAMVGAGLGASEGASVVGVPGVRVVGEAVTGAEVVMEPFLLPFLVPLSFLPPLVVLVAVGAAVTMTGEVLAVVDATGASVGALVVEAFSALGALTDLRARRVSALEPDERARAATARTKSLFCIIIVL